MAFGTSGFVRVLKIRDFALLWSAQLISVIGDWILTAALLVFVYKLTGEKTAVGLMLLFEALPIVLFGCVAGTVVDCCNRKAVMIVSDVGRGAAVLLLLLVQSPAQTWIVYAVAFVTGMFGLLFRPARAASIPNMVPSNLLVPANSLASLNETIGMLIGPVIGGALAFGLFRVASALDAVTFFLSAVILGFTVIPQEQVGSRFARLKDLRKEILDGAGFIVRNRLVRSLFFVIGLAVVAIGVCNVLEVVFAMDELGLSGKQFGMLLFAGGFGMLVGSLLVGHLGSRIPSNATFSAGVICLGASILMFSRVPNFHSAMVVLAFMGMGSVASSVGSLTIFQTATPNVLQGRTIALSWVICTALNLGAMGLAGVAADRFGVRQVLMVSGLLALGGGLASVPLLRGLCGDALPIQVGTACPGDAMSSPPPEHSISATDVVD